MKKSRFALWTVLLLLLLPALFGQETEAEAETAAYIAAAPSGPLQTAWFIPIEGTIAPSTVTFVRREARRAINEGADFLVFEIDTLGGRVDSTLQITSFIMSIRGPTTIAWVRNSETGMGVSWSAGAMIAISNSQIFMANGTSMGAAAPVIVGPGGTEGAGGKTLAAVRSQIAATAERNGHSTGIALAMVDFDVELWEVEIDGTVHLLDLQEIERLESMRPGQIGTPAEIRRIRVVSPPGSLLSLTAMEAHRYGLTSGMADDREALLAYLGASSVIGDSAPSPWDSLVAFLVSGPAQGVLILLGLILLFMELQSPGFGVAGTLGLICFVLVFGSSFMLGRVGSLEIILFIVGITLLAIEIFLLPGFGILGISGILVIGLSLLFSMQDFIIPRFDWEWTLMGRNVIVVVVGFVSAVTIIAILALLGPKTRMFDMLTLKTQISQSASEGSGWQSDGGVQLDHVRLLGKTGKTITALRPIGKAEIENEIFQVETDSSFVETGEDIKVVKIHGNIIIVRRA